MDMRKQYITLVPTLLFFVGLMAVRPTAAQVDDILTYRYNNARSGANLKETVLKKSNVKSGTFGKLAFRNVDGNIYAQPLIVLQAKIAVPPDPVRTMNVAIVATEHNSVYAFDADDTSPDQPFQLTGKALWHRGPDAAPAPDSSPGLGESVQSADVYTRIGANFCADLTTEVGITGTPVIKLTQNTAPKEGVIFVAAKSMSGTQFTYTLFALSLADGKPLNSGVPIEGKVSGPNGTMISFDPLFQLNRPALLLDQNTLYVAFGGHCDAGDYRGWVFAYDVSDPSAPKKLDVYSTTFTKRTGGMNDKDGRGGIWMSGYGLAMDGSDIYFSTGDGTYNVTNPQFPELSNSVVKARLVAGRFRLQDWYSPQNRDHLKTFDTDLGAAGAVLVPNSHLLIAGGKEGRMYLIDRNDMGRGTKVSLQSFQVTNAPHDLVQNPNKAGDIAFWNIHGSPVIWPLQGRMFVYVMGEEDHLRQYKLVPDAAGAGWRFDTAFQKISKETVGLPPPNELNDPKHMIFMPGGFLTVSANGTDATTAIAWATMPYAANANMQVVAGALRAFDASDVSKGELWDSEKSPDDKLGFFAKYNPPVVANGKVYVAAFQQERLDNGQHLKSQGGLQPALVIYGLK
jgi:hypothetical protein